MNPVDLSPLFTHERRKDSGSFRIFKRWSCTYHFLECILRAQFLSPATDNPKIDMTHNSNDSDAKRRNKFADQVGEVAMQNIRRYRAMGSLCRQQAAYHPEQSWKFLAKALYWEHLADVEMSSDFENTETSDSSRWHIAAA
jgi:hypothetical protein